MAEKMVSVTEAREFFAELLNQVAYSGQRYLICRRGFPLVALVPADELDEAPGAERPAAAEKPAVAAKSEGQPEISPELQAELEEKLRAYNLKVALEEEEFRENYERENREADRRWEEYTARHRGG